MELIIREILYIFIMFTGIILYEVVSGKCFVCYFGGPFFPDIYKWKWKREVIQDWLIFLFLFIFPGVFVGYGWPYLKLALLGIFVLYQSYTLQMLKISCYIRKKSIK